MEMLCGTEGGLLALLLSLRCPRVAWVLQPASSVNWN